MFQSWIWILLVTFKTPISELLSLRRLHVTWEPPAEKLHLKVQLNQHHKPLGKIKWNKFLTSCTRHTLTRDPLLILFNSYWSPYILFKCFPVGVLCCLKSFYTKLVLCLVWWFIFYLLLKGLSVLFLAWRTSKFKCFINWDQIFFRW